MRQGFASPHAKRHAQEIRCLRLCQFAQEFPHTPRTFVDVCLGHWVGDANVLGGSEGLAGDGDYVRLMQQPRGQFGSCLDAALADKAAYSGRRKRRLPAWCR